jgi:hypothetical protein
VSWDTGAVTIPRKRAVPPQPEPHPKPAKPRLLQDGRDMFWSLAPLVLACIVLAGLVGMCSFQPTGPHSGPPPSFDAAAALRADAAQLGFPVRVPQLPDDWHANSGRRGNFDAARTSTIGYLTPGNHYLSLTQSNGSEQQVVASISRDLHPTGVQSVDGVTWVVYEGADEPVWTGQLDGPGRTQIAITGSGDAEEFRTLAAATQHQQPLPAR